MKTQKWEKDYPQFSQLLFIYQETLKSELNETYN
jgi:hypothetical protein